jgi:hypothetical protein
MYNKKKRESMMYNYFLYGLIFQSEIEMPQLIAIEDIPKDSLIFEAIQKKKAADVHISVSGVPSQIRNFAEAGYVSGKQTGGFWYQNDKGIFLITQGQRIDVELLGNATYSQVIPFILGYCVATLFEQRHMLAVHCSSIELSAGGIIIAGYSGSGKSSLTTRFLEQEAKLLTDDVAVIGIHEEQIRVFPGFPQQNLCHDIIESYGYDKTKLKNIDVDRNKYVMRRTEQFSVLPNQLKAMFILCPKEGRQVEAVELLGNDKLQCLIENLFMKTAMDSHGLSKDVMDLCIQVCKRVPMYRLYRPLMGDSTKEQEQIIRNLV